MLHGRLRLEGWAVNLKRVRRLRREEGLKVPRKPVKRLAKGTAANACHVSPPTRPNEVWTWDFTHGFTASGRPLKWLSIVDEFTRELLVLRAARRCTAADCQEAIALLVRQRGAPAALRSDNGPEFVAKALRAWLAQLGIGTRFVAPGSPWQNGLVESFHARMKDEFVKPEVFLNLHDAAAKTAAWQADYNQARPHSALGYRTPAAFAAAWRKQPASAPTGGVPNQPTAPEVPALTIVPGAAAQQPPGVPPVMRSS
jgi:transposase InsO family protein